MKTLQFITLFTFIVSISYGQQALTIINTSGCSVTYTMVASSDCSSGCNCDHLSSTGVIPASTTYSYANAYEFQTGVVTPYAPGHSWVAGAGLGGVPLFWAWGEVRFSFDCGSGQCDAGEMGIPASSVCTITPAASWGSIIPYGCGIPLSGTYSYSSGDVTITF